MEKNIKEAEFHELLTKSKKIKNKKTKYIVRYYSGKSGKLTVIKEYEFRLPDTD